MDMSSIIFRSRIFLTALAVILSASACTKMSKPLDIYFVDVEGGQATLIVAPGGETMLIDAGYPGKGKSDPTPGDPNVARDAQRIVAAAADAGVLRIDYLLVTHFHGDHFGGVMELAQLMPIGTILDHGTEAAEAQGKPRSLELIRAYKKTREQSSYRVPTVGDRLMLDDVAVTVVSSGGVVLESPLDGAGAANATCDRLPFAPRENSLNPRSTGVLIRFGDFRFLDLGDLVGQPLSDLVCPTNRIGEVDVYLVSHHGIADADDPATLAAFRPRVAVLNNGAMKGGEAPIFDILRSADALEDVWQIDRSAQEGAENFPAEFIANLDTETEHWIRISADKGGSFRVFNRRTGKWKRYDAD
jgi:beta-lactamase superfamily II metal-dependent hydrolase